MPSLHRKRQLDDELSRIVERLKTRYQPEKVIVFGSYSRGRVGRWSDLDIAIIKRTRKRFLDRTHEAAKAAKSSVGVDFLVYTPNEYQQLRAQGHYFIKEIERGRTIYDKHATG